MIRVHSNHKLIMMIFFLISVSLQVFAANKLISSENISKTVDKITSSEIELSKKVQLLKMLRQYDVNLTKNDYIKLAKYLPNSDLSMTLPVIELLIATKSSTFNVLNNSIKQILLFKLKKFGYLKNITISKDYALLIVKLLEYYNLTLKDGEKNDKGIEEISTVFINVMKQDLNNILNT